MKTKFMIISVILFTTILFQVSAVTLKMASLLPTGTEWDNALNKMAGEWRDSTDGRVRVKIYPGGIAGTESDVIRKMRIGQIDMAVLTSIGMTTIVPDTFSMSMPFMIESEEELDFIVKEVTPIFEEAFLEKGFITLTWAKTGWVNFFSKDKVIEPEDMMRMKFAGSATQPELSNSFKKMGFNVVSIEIPDILMGLQSGMVSALYTAPMASASYQWFAIAQNMLDMKVSPVLGGIVITERAWRKIPDNYKPELIASAVELSSNFFNEAVALEKKAIDVMLDNGLKINSPETDTRSHWRALLGDNFSVIVGENGFVSAESFQKVSAMLDEFRSR